MKVNRCSWYVVGAALGLGGSLLLPVCGKLLQPLVSRLSVDYALLEYFGAGLGVLFFALLAFGIYCLNVAVDRTVPVESGCSRRQMPEPAPRGRAQRTARRGSGSVFTNFL